MVVGDVEPDHWLCRLDFRLASADSQYEASNAPLTPTKQTYW